MTFSVAARCARTGMFGAVVASSSPAVAARCTWARAGVGAACTQNITDPSLGPLLLDLLAQGLSAREAMNQVVAQASHAEHRQLTVVDMSGRVATYSGARTLGVHRTASGADVVAAGNLLSSPEVPAAMVTAFEADRGAPLGDRLLAALRAGDDAGGEEGPVRSCGVVIADRTSWPVTDLRVDWSEHPIDELSALWELWQPQAEDYVTRALHPERAPSYGVPGDE